MIVYRITNKKHAEDISGTGAALHGGRWNKKGYPVLYTSESKELALLETIVNTTPMLVPELSILEIEIPDDSIYKLRSKDLPDTWYHYPAPDILAEISESIFKRENTIALKVPSTVIHTSYNYILNCRHTSYNKKVKIKSVKDFYFDPRLKR